MGVTSIRISAEVEVPLEQLARKLDRSKNYLVNQAIKEFLHRRALDEARWSDTLEALNSVKNGALVEEKDVSAWLQTWGNKKPKSPPAT